MQTVKPGKKVVVTRMDSSRAEGKLLSIDAGSVSVEVDRLPVKIEKNNVFRLRYADIRMKRTLIGLGIGAGAGFLIGAASGDAIVNRQTRGAVLAVFGLGIGSAAGAAFPIGPPLYEAAERVRRTPPVPASK